MTLHRFALLATFAAGTLVATQSFAATAAKPNKQTQPPIGANDDPLRACKGVIIDHNDNGTPFSNVGKCFKMPLISVSQWIDEKTAIVNALPVFALPGVPMFGAAPVLIDFPTPPEHSRLGPSIVVGEGAFQYTAVSGALTTIPRAKYLGPAISDSVPQQAPAVDYCRGLANCKVEECHDCKIEGAPSYPLPSPENSPRLNPALSSIPTTRP